MTTAADLQVRRNCNVGGEGSISSTALDSKMFLFLCTCRLLPVKMLSSHNIYKWLLSSSFSKIFHAIPLHVSIKYFYALHAPRLEMGGWEKQRKVSVLSFYFLCCVITCTSFYEEATRLFSLPYKHRCRQHCS